MKKNKSVKKIKEKFRESVDESGYSTLEEAKEWTKLKIKEDNEKFIKEK